MLGRLGGWGLGVWAGVQKKLLPDLWEGEILADLAVASGGRELFIVQPNPDYSGLIISFMDSLTLGFFLLKGFLTLDDVTPQMIPKSRENKKSQIKWSTC